MHGSCFFRIFARRKNDNKQSDMNPYAQAVILTASTLRMLPHLLLYVLHRKQIDRDLEKYREGKPSVSTFIRVATRQKWFRNLFYYRMGEYKSVFIKWLLPPDPSLHIWCPSIGEGAHFEHNYSTYLNAESIGRDFYCLQMVTLGNGKDGRPTIGDNVKIYTGAIVYGNIHVGNDVTIAAGTVLSTDVPDHSFVSGNPAVIVPKRK